MIKNFGEILLFICLLLLVEFELHAASLQLIVVDQKSKPVKNAVVKIIPTVSKISVKPQASFIDQINKEYVPTVIVVGQGSPVTFPNKDNIKHHVYSFSKAKQFELPLYEGTPANPVSFDIPGVVVLGCNIHDWMRGYIYVTDSPYAAISDAKGVVNFTALPSEEVKVFVWHPQLKNQQVEQSIDLSANSEQSIDITLSLKPTLKIRRSTSNRRRRYN